MVICSPLSSEHGFARLERGFVLCARSLGQPQLWRFASQQALLWAQSQHHSKIETEGK